MIQDNSSNFLKFSVENQVLKFGDFTLKSGRQSPYFFNTGLINNGGTISQLGEFYAKAILESCVPCDMLYGPAYKGIPLVVATVMSIHKLTGKNIPFAFNRKEAKDHGEGGVIVGAPLEGRVLIIDDVISAGTSVRESAEIIKNSNATLAGVVISLDRQERGKDDKIAVEEVTATLNVPVISIATLTDLIALLKDCPQQAQWFEKINAYKDQYGK